MSGQRPTGERPQLSEDFHNVRHALVDPIYGSPAKGRRVLGVVCLHVDDLFLTGNDTFLKRVLESLRRDYKFGSEDTDDIMFTGQRVKWQGQSVVVDQTKAVEELTEVDLPKGAADSTPCSPEQHTEFRSVLGSLNWLQSRTQYHICYAFSRLASASAAPTIGDVRALNKLVRTVRARSVKLYFHPLKGPLRIVGYPDASYRNNSDFTTQRALCIFLAEARADAKPGTAKGAARGSLIDYESQKIKRTVLSTTVAELYAFMKCFGSCQLLRGLWMDLSGMEAPINMRTDANNLVTTAATTRLPEQKETIHMIQMLRKEACSGAIEDLAHVKTEYCLSDPLTKGTIKADTLVQAVETGVLPEIDANPLFRKGLQHKAYFGGTTDHEPQEDYWQFKDHLAIRVHTKPRTALYFPAQLPSSVSAISPSRETRALHSDGSSTIRQDTWKRSTTRLPVAWTGTTVFLVLEWTESNHSQGIALAREDVSG